MFEEIFVKVYQNKTEYKMDTENQIPTPTDKLSKYWSQPPKQDITLDDTHALMSLHTFKCLKDYSRSQPTGAWVGKMWKKQKGDTWFLCWFGNDSDPRYLKNHYREILLLGDTVTPPKGEPMPRTVEYYKKRGDADQELILLQMAEIGRHTATINDLQQKLERGKIDAIALEVGDKITVYDRYRFAIPLDAEIVRFCENNDGMRVKLLKSNNSHWPVGSTIVVDRNQCRKAEE